MTPPQAVTERYVSNLIHYGRNKEFDITTISRQIHRVDYEPCGYYFFAQVEQSIAGGKAEYGNGPTLSRAVRRALEKHGVTFR